VSEVNSGAAASYPYTLTIDGLCAACQTYTTQFTCCPTIGLTPASLPNGTVGTPYSQVLTPTAGTAPFTFNVSGLPAGMTPTAPVVGSTVTIGGTPTATFSGTVTVSGTDANGCPFTQNFPLTVGSVCPPPPPLVVNAPSIVGAGSPNRIASVGLIGGAVYAWTITNGTITAGQGTNQITFTAGTAGTPLTLSVNATVGLCPFGGGFANVTVAPVGSAVQFYPFAPCRLVDTRNANGPLGGPALAASGSADRTFTLAGACGIPAGAVALSVNLTVVNPAAGGFLSIYRGDGSLTGTTSISFDVVKTRANNAILELATDGSGAVKVNNSSAGTVDFILDVNGYFQ
jgi:large repetitive protein